jgi:hypothetical protein
MKDNPFLDTSHFVSSHETAVDPQILSLVASTINLRRSHDGSTPMFKVLENIFKFETLDNLTQNDYFFQRTQLFCDIICSPFATGQSRRTPVKLPRNLSRDKYFSNLIEPLIPYLKKLSVKQLLWIFKKSASKSCRRYECIEHLQSAFFEKIKEYSSQELSDIYANFDNLGNLVVTNRFKKHLLSLKEQRLAQEGNSYTQITKIIKRETSSGPLVTARPEQRRPISVELRDPLLHPPRKKIRIDLTQEADSDDVSSSACDENNHDLYVPPPCYALNNNNTNYNSPLVIMSESENYVLNQPNNDNVDYGQPPENINIYPAKFQQGSITRNIQSTFIQQRQEVCDRESTIAHANAAPAGVNYYLNQPVIAPSQFFSPVPGYTPVYFASPPVPSPNHYRTCFANVNLSYWDPSDPRHRANKKF